MTFWSGDKLAALGVGLDLVAEFDVGKIDCSAYTLTLGPEAFVTPKFGDEGPNFKQKLDTPQSIQIGTASRNIGGGELVIPAGQFAFLLTEEFIKIPKNTMGFISLKSAVKWKGLINVSGFHVDPGFHGRLVYSVYNAGPSSIHIYRGEPLFLLWIADLDRDSTVDFRKPSNNILAEIPSKLISEVDRPLHSLQSLSEKMEVIQRNLTLLYRVLAALAVIGGLIFAGWALLPANDDRSSSGLAVEAIS